MGRFLVVVMVVLSSVLVAAPGGASMSSREQRGMTQKQAADYYLKGACRPKPAENRFIRQIWRGREYIPESEVRRRLPQLRRLAGANGRERLAASRYLTQPPSPWPASVSRLVRKLARDEVKFARIRLAQSRARTAGRWLKLNGEANRMRWSNAPSQIRFRLGLPEVGRGC